jgi:Icc-related predicted phosphoesterase
MHEGSANWIKKEFIPWCEKQPCDKVFLIAGNHDWFFMRHPDEVDEIFKDNEKITYLCDSLAEYVDKDYNTYRIYGTPWCHQFYNWAFMTSDVELENIYNKIPYKVDILMTHDAPHGTSDVLLQEDIPWASDSHIGCIPLGNAVDDKKPILLLHGHLHSTNHECEMRGETEVYNVSMVDERYKKVYKPFYKEI